MARRLAAPQLGLGGGRRERRLGGELDGEALLADGDAVALQYGAEVVAHLLVVLVEREHVLHRRRHAALGVPAAS